MPYKSEKQRKFMKGCQHNPGKMKGKCPPSKVLKDYAAASKGKK